MNSEQQHSATMIAPSGSLSPSAVSRRSASASLISFSHATFLPSPDGLAVSGVNSTAALIGERCEVLKVATLPRLESSHY